MKTARILAWVAHCMLLLAAPAALAGYSLAPYQNVVTGSWADAVAIGDINGDGRDDVALTTTFYFDESNDYKVFVYFQNADGSLDAPRKYSYLSMNGTGIALADLDRDGRKDIVVGHGAGITILRWGRVHGTMSMRSRLFLAQAVEDLPADDVVVVDVDRDGALDVVAQSWSDGAIVYFGDGHGSIRRQVALATPADGYNDLESGDFNGDGYQDVAVLSGQGTTHAYVYYNDGTDDLSPPLEVNPNPDEAVTIGALGSGDFNGDGREDLVVMRDRTNVSLYRQTAGGALQAPLILASALDPNAMAGHDLDLDGRDDLIVQHGGGALGIYLQGADGLAAETVVPGPYGTWFNTQGVAAGDINGDACPDVVNANYNYGLVVFLGSGCNPVPDLVPSLGLTRTVVALRLDNLGAGDALAPEADITLSLNTGSLSIGTLPGGCILQSQAARRAKVRCSGATLSAGSNRTVLLAIALAGGDARSALTVIATVNTTSVEMRLDNNRTSRSLRGWAR